MKGELPINSNKLRTYHLPIQVNLMHIINQSCSDRCIDDAILCEYWQVTRLIIISLRYYRAERLQLETWHINSVFLMKRWHEI